MDLYPKPPSLIRTFTEFDEWAQNVTLRKDFDEQAPIPVANVKGYGAKGDGVTDDTAAINAAFASGAKTIYFPAGRYLYSGKMQNKIGVGQRIIGEGSFASIIKFTDPSVDSLFELTGISLHSITIEGICFQGPGKTAGTGIKGIYIHDLDFSPFNMHFEDVWVTDVSGTAFYIYPAFSWSMVNCCAQRVGGNGFELGCGPKFYGIGLGRYNDDIAGWSYWFIDGSPVILSCNTGSCTSGMRFGTPPGDPRGALYCWPFLFSVNIEPFTDTGILFEEGSTPQYINGISLYAATNTTVNYGIRLKYPNSIGIIGSDIKFLTQTEGSYLNKIYVDNAESGLILLTKADQTTLDTLLSNDGAKNSIFPLGVYNSMAYRTVGIGSQSNKARIHGIVNFASVAPYTPKAGDVYWDNANKVLKVYDGTAWKTISAT